MLRILIASPYPALRAGLHILLEEAQRARGAEPVMVVGEADSVEASLQWTRATQPQVVVYDLAFEMDDGLDGLWRLRGQSPEVAVLALCEANGDGRVLAALQGGARGCLPKTATGAELLEAAQSAVAGRAGAASGHDCHAAAADCAARAGAVADAARGRGGAPGGLRPDQQVHCAEAGHQRAHG